MARSRTLTAMLSDVRLRADLVGNQFVTDAEITEYLNQSIAELFDKLVGARGQEYYAVETVIVTTGVEMYALPVDHYETLYIDAEYGGTRYRLTSYSMHERAELLNAITSAYPAAFRCIAATISLLPVSSGCSVHHWYTPAATRLVSGGDSFDGVNGWEEYAIWRTVAYCQSKEQLDPSIAMGFVQQMGQRIDRLAPFRAANNTERVTDVGRFRTNDPSRYLPRP